MVTTRQENETLVADQADQIEENGRETETEEATPTAAEPQEPETADEAAPQTDEAPASEEQAEEPEMAIHLPDPSIWPFVIALGIAVLMSGIVLHLAVLLSGLAILVFGFGGWIYQDIQVARRTAEHHGEH